MKLGYQARDLGKEIERIDPVLDCKRY